ncbi:MAG: GvpL/GvpF family gas vesicle protein [Chlamydiae bacterium]|nr:GvpL/GvpF family gas vesicle protein [Chlamydiota bacterium]MBI3266491.1 GvpL/GvpF family gas vesicle protein [Chlamydiota bacterium]
MEKMGFWVYCVIENKAPLKIEAQGIHGTSAIEVVSDGDFAAVVSEEPMKKYHLTRDFLMAHQLVNEKVMQIQPVLPVKFCTLAETKDQIVRQVLKRQEKVREFQETFAKIQGKSELGLRARWKNLEEVFSKLSQENEKVIAAKEKIMKMALQERHTALIDVGHVVKEALEEKNIQMAETLIHELAPWAVQHKKQNVLGDVNIMNVAFLVEDEKQASFDEVVNNLEGRYGSQIQFKYVGPIPPFNFVEIVIQLEEEGGKFQSKAELIERS